MSTVAVLGEALVDLLQEPDGRFRPHLGGSPFNLARALARQQVAVSYLDPISRDGLGQQLHAALGEEGVERVGPRSDRPTSLALVQVGAAGQPRYRLYRGQVADSDWGAEARARALAQRPRIAHSGSLALAPDRVEFTARWLEAMRRAGALTSVDINLRPGAVQDLPAYLAGVRRVLTSCDLVKLSVEDLDGLGEAPEPELRLRAASLRAGSPRAALVALTAGDQGAVLANRRGERWHPAEPVARVVDAIGAGDCFQAGLLAGLLAEGLVEDLGLADCSPARLAPVLDRAQRCAAAVVGVAGCDPPRR